MNYAILFAFLFMTSFIGWFVVVYVVMALVSTRPFATWNHKKYMSIITVISVVAALTELSKEVKEENSKITKANPEARLSVDEELRVRDIIKGVLQDPDFITPEIHSEFWGYLNKDGVATDLFLAEQKELLTGIILKQQKYFYEDAICAVTSGKPTKSVKREQYEKALLAKGIITESRVNQNEEIIRKIAEMQPISVDGNEIIMTEDILKTVLGSLDATSRRVDHLFTKP